MMQQPATGITVVPLTSQPPGITPAFGEVAHVTVQLQPTLNDIGDQVLTSPTDVAPNQAQIEAEKKAVYKHPLFPLLSLIFERSEHAMHTCEPLSADTFAADIHSFVQKQEQDRKPFFSDDPDLDNLMIKAIQVLRIHLLELEKVNELCKDFCSRYIAVLKTKMQNHFQNENIFRPDYLPNSLQEQLNAATPATPNPNLVVTATTSTASSSTSSIVVQPPAVSMATINQSQLVSGQTVYQMVQTPQGIVAQPIQIQTTPITGQAVIQGNTPLGAIGANIVQTVDTNSNVTIAPATGQVSGQSEDEEDCTGKGKKNKRGVLPKHATNIMRSWLFQHIVHPYPTEDEKRQIAQQTNLTLLQVNNWFINARRRILQPMLDASNPDPTPKAKKPKTANTKPAVQRFWPESIAASIQEGVQNSLEAQPQQNTIQQIIIPTSAVVAVDGKIITAGTTLTGCDIIQQMQQQVAAAASSAATSIVIPSVKGTTPVPIAPKIEIKPDRSSIDGDGDGDSGGPDADMLSLDCDSAGEEMSNS